MSNIDLEKNLISYNSDEIYDQIQQHYNKFKSFYISEKEFKLIYDQLCPLIEVYISNKNHLKSLLEKLGYSKYVYEQEKLQNLIHNNTCDILADIDKGWFYDYIYYIFKTSGNDSFILCHYHLKTTKFYSKFFLYATLVGSTYYYFDSVIVKALDDIIKNKKLLEDIAKYVIDFGGKIGITKFFIDRFEKYIKNIDVLEQEKRQDIIYACMMFKTNEYWITNLKTMKTIFK